MLPLHLNNIRLAGAPSMAHQSPSQAPLWTRKVSFKRVAYVDAVALVVMVSVVAIAAGSAAATVAVSVAATVVEQGAASGEESEEVRFDALDSIIQANYN